ADQAFSIVVWGTVCGYGSRPKIMSSNTKVLTGQLGGDVSGFARLDRRKRAASHCPLSLYGVFYRPSTGDGAQTRFSRYCGTAYKHFKRFMFMQLVYALLRTF